MGKIIFLIGLGGGIGSIARFLIQQYMSRHVVISFPLGTLIVNVVGCFLIGIIYGLLGKSQSYSRELILFLTTGVCGGFTTFSTFSYESIALIKEGNYAYGFLYVFGSLLICLSATFSGAVLINILNNYKS
jgi:CrcB protein